jgi:hypothetical protein
MITARQLCSSRFSGEALDIAVAVGMAEGSWFLDAVGDHYQIRPLIKVLPGDTLFSIACDMGMDGYDELQRVNAIPDADRIEAGRWLWNPRYNPRSKADPQYRSNGRFKWGPSCSPFQIRTLVDPSDWGGDSRVRDVDWLRLEIGNCVEAAFRISEEGTNWEPWTMFRNGGYKKYLGQDFPLRLGWKRAARWNVAGERLWTPADDRIYDNVVWPDWALPKN